MKTAEFLPSLYTRNEVVDGQHKELIKRINDLYAALASEDEATRAAKAEETLNFLAEYTVFHFASCCVPIGCLRRRCATWAAGPRTRCADAPNYSVR